MQYLYLIPMSIKQTNKQTPTSHHENRPTKMVREPKPLHLSISEEHCLLVSSHPPLLCTYVQHIVSSDERISVLILQLSIYILLCLFQGYIHVAIQAGQDPWRKVRQNSKLQAIS